MHVMLLIRQKGTGGNILENLSLFHIDLIQFNKFSRITLWSFIVVSQKLKLISANFFLPMTSRNELSYTIT